MAITTMTIAGILGILRKRWWRLKAWCRRRRRGKDLHMIHGQRGEAKTFNPLSSPPRYQILHPSDITMSESPRITSFKMRTKVLDEQDPVVKKYKKIKEESKEGNL